MRHYPFKLVNVFAETSFGGNPLVVFPQEVGLTDGEMQQIAKQFNLSEAVFVLPSSDQSAVGNLRIFTPKTELPFAGHPTLGAAFVVQQQQRLPEHFVLNTNAKTVNITGKDAKMTLAIQGYECKICVASPQQLAEAVGLAPNQIAETAYWLNSGSPHLLLQIKDKTAIEQVNIHATRLEQIRELDGQPRAVIYLWHEQNCEQHEKIIARFFSTHQGVVAEDSGTGSACANLGAYFLSQEKFPLNRLIC